jgi:hypothetical protein
MKYHFLHKRSSVSGKTPSVSALHYGELAINFNADSPKLHIKNSSDKIVSFIDEEQVKSIIKTETSALDKNIEALSLSTQKIIDGRTVISKAEKDSDGNVIKTTYVKQKDYNHTLGTALATSESSKYLDIRHNYNKTLAIPYATENNGGAMSSEDKKALTQIIEGDVYVKQKDYNYTLGTAINTSELSKYLNISHNYNKTLAIPYATENNGGAMSPEDKKAIIENKNAIVNKQEKLESGVNIKTINGMPILGEGDITITSGGEIVGDYATTSFVNEKIESITDTLSDYTKESAFTEHVESATTRLNQISESLQDKVTSVEVQEMIEQIKQDSDVVALTERVKENEEVHAAALTKLNSLTTNISTKVNTLSGEVTNINSITTNIIENLASKLSSGDIKTINNQSIIGKGNIDIIGNGACNSTYHIMLEKIDKGGYSLEFIEHDNKENWLTKLVSFNNNGNTEFGVAINVTQIADPNLCYIFFHDKIIQFVCINGEWKYNEEHIISAPQTSTQSLYYITLKENEDKDNLEEKYDLEFDNTEDRINWVTKLVKFGNHTGIAIRGDESGEPYMCHIFFSDRELHFIDQNNKWRCVSEEYYNYITESEVDTKISGVIGTVQLSGKLNLASLEDVKSAQSVLISTNQVAYYLITDNEGKIPSNVPCYRVPEDVATALGCSSPHTITQATLGLLDISLNGFGVNVGDLIALTRVKVKVSDLASSIGKDLSILGNTEIEIYQYKILSTNDAKPYGYNGVAEGVAGLMSPWDKEQVNKISSIADVANKALAFPTFNVWDNNMNECFESGIYPWCLTGRPEGSANGTHYTCVVEKSTTVDTSGFYTIVQTCYGREGVDEGKIFKRIIFRKEDGTTNWGVGWKQINIEPRISENEEVQAAALVKMENEITQLKQKIQTMQEQINNLLNV